MKKPCPRCATPILITSALCRVCNASGLGKRGVAKRKMRPRKVSGYWGMRRYETMNKLLDQQFGASHASTETIPQP